MKKIILQFISGADANKEYTFDVNENLNITIGRETVNKIIVADTEIMVSRKHVTIRLASKFDSTDGKPQHELIILDFSSNGAFVNGKKVNLSMPITDEDEIQLGEKGPKLKLACFPKQVKMTHIMEVNKEKVTIVTPPFAASTSSEPVTPPSKRADTTSFVNQPSVSAPVASTASDNLLKFLGVGLVMFLGIGGAGIYYYQQNNANRVSAEEAIEGVAKNQKAELKEATPQKILSEWAGVVVFITAYWQMVDLETKKPIYHKFHKSNNHEYMLPVYEKQKNGMIYPVLTSDPEVSDCVLGGVVMGTGFVVGSDGIIMTNANIVEKWTDRFKFTKPGVLFEEMKDKKGVSFFKESLITDEHLESLKNWNPSDVKYFNPRNQRKQPQTGTQKQAKLIGQNLLLEVRFPGNDLRFKARFLVSSEKHNVALIKVDVDSPIKALDLNASAQHNAVLGGERVVMLGYPTMPSKTYVTQPSNLKNLNSTTENSTNKISVVDMASVAEGIVSKAPVNLIGEKQFNVIDVNYKSSVLRGDYIEMSMSYSGEGNNGGPVFNSDGKVIGVFTSNISGEYIGASTGLAIPIQYGLELLNPTLRVVK